ncbi:VOC family protein [Marmoricola sp. RAF53]|uniref:VOC family protein n=1 Tax=Marmoricola sp. RAF53 TaxID=3233059 RepID=UPI003F9C6DCA
MHVTIDELVVADDPSAWTAAGFTVDPDGVCRIGTVRVRLVGRVRGKGIVAWSLRGAGALDGALDGDLDGIPTTLSDAPPATPATHPNGVTLIDHVVLLSPDLARTVAVLRAVGLEPRRERDGELGGAAVRQVFYRMGEVILEVVGSPDTSGDGPASLWGLTHTVADIDATAARLGDRTSPVKDAVQPGRRITTLRHRELDLSVRTALISPDPRHG